MYIMNGYELFRTEYKPPALPNDATPQVTKRWFLGNPNKRLVYYFRDNSSYDVFYFWGIVFDLIFG